eukprot:COSAG05_NODE_3082_length_2338_cov_1.901295_6_plen_141_part_00
MWEIAVAETSLGRDRYRCWEQVSWIMEVGVLEYPELFPHLNATSSPELVQCEIRDSESVIACTDTPCGIQEFGRGVSGFACPEYSGHTHDDGDDHGHDDDHGHAVANASNVSTALVAHGPNEVHEHTMPKVRLLHTNTLD